MHPPRATRSAFSRSTSACRAATAPASAAALPCGDRHNGMVGILRPCACRRQPGYGGSHGCNHTLTPTPPPSPPCMSPPRPPRGPGPAPLPAPPAPAAAPPSSSEPESTPAGQAHAGATGGPSCWPAGRHSSLQCEVPKLPQDTSRSTQPCHCPAPATPLPTLMGRPSWLKLRLMASVRFLWIFRLVSRSDCRWEGRRMGSAHEHQAEQHWIN